MAAPPREVVYVNGGEIYKAPNGTALGGNYLPDQSADPIFAFSKADGKRYIFTPEFKEFFGDTGVPGVTLAGRDLCPAVTLWISLGATDPAEAQNFDIFFAADSTQQLRDVATYYGLPYPITDEVGTVLDQSPQHISFWNAGGKPIVPGGIKFIDGKPSILKLYTYPKPYGSWDIWMYGASYFDHGQCFERGAVYEKQTGGEALPGAQMRGKLSFTKAEVIYSERADGVYTSYAFVDKDPLMFWQGNEIDANGNVLRVKRYETAREVQRAIVKMDKGADFTGCDLCPDVQFWVGRSWYDDADEVEMLFAVTGGSAMLDAVAAYYGLPIPYSPEQKAVLDTTPELYRARHYDLLGMGEGNYLPVVVASVTLIDGQPKRLLLYTFLRQWEFEDEIVLPPLAIE